MSRTRARLALATTVGMIATGAFTAVAVAPAQATSSPTIKVFVTKSHEVRMATHLHPGVHKFGVRSGTRAAFQLARPHGHYTKAMLAHDVNTGLAVQDSSTPAALRAIKRFERHVTLLGGVPSAPHRRGVLWVNLTRGSYWAVDTMPSTLLVRNVLTVHVGGHRVAGAMPGGKTIRAIDEATWARRPASIPHRGIIHFTNNSTDNHFITMAKILPGKTMRDVRRFFKAAASGQDPGQPPIDFNSHGIDSGALSPGHTMAMRYDIDPGRWVVMCFWPDAEHGGMPHAFMGMLRGITVR